MTNIQFHSCSRCMESQLLARLRDELQSHAGTLVSPVKCHRTNALSFTSQSWLAGWPPLWITVYLCRIGAGIEMSEVSHQWIETVITVVYLFRCSSYFFNCPAVLADCFYRWSDSIIHNVHRKLLNQAVKKFSVIRIEWLFLLIRLLANVAWVQLHSITSVQWLGAAPVLL